MSIRYLFNTAGDYVAFVQGYNVFAPNAEWLGFIRNGNLFYTADGNFQGYILEDDRVVQNKAEPPKPRTMAPLRPLRPLIPLKPLRRLRKPNLPFPYEDFFEHGVAGISVDSLATIQVLNHLDGAELRAADGTFLGKITRNAFDTESISNQYGNYGNQYSSTSIFNEYGQYGGTYSNLSPFNEYSRTPPSILKNGQIVSYLTNNQFISPRVDPENLKAWLQN